MHLTVLNELTLISFSSTSLVVDQRAGVGTVEPVLTQGRPYINAEITAMEPSIVG